MEPRIIEELHAVRQLPKLRSLLKRYRHAKIVQIGLLNLSELSSTVNDMVDFYPALRHIIYSLLNTENFHIALVEQSGHLQLTYCHNPIEKHLLEHLKKHDWLKSLTGLVFSEREVMHCNAVQRMELSKSGRTVLYGSSCIDWLGVPLKRGHQTIGVIALQSYEKNVYFDDRDCQLLEFIAEHIVTAIDRIKSRKLLEQSIQHRTNKLTQTNRILQDEIAERQKAVKIHKALLSLSEMSSVAGDFDLFLNALHNKIKPLIYSENLYIALNSIDNNNLELLYFINQNHNDENAKILAKDLANIAMKSAKPILINDGKITSLSSQDELTSKPYIVENCAKNMPKAWLSAPLIDKGKVIGVLAIQHYQNSHVYQKSDLELIRFIAQHLVVVISRQRAQIIESQHNDQLARLVNERTKELQESNLNLQRQIKERQKAEEQLYFEAHHDGLTKLANRAMFSDRLSYAISHLKRYSDYRFAVLFIDLDRFKMINDTLGHHVGDLLLIEISARLQECVRENDVLARLGGDEFVILLDSLQCEDDVEDVAARIITAIAKPFTLEGHVLHSNASIGITLCGPHYKDAHEMLRDADAAMYQAKHLGCGRYVFFDETIRDQLIASLTLEQELRQAIKEQQFELHYQKICDLKSNELLGFESFLRWKHPSRGILTPSEFIYMAEETGLIVDIDAWLIEEISRQCMAWEMSGEYKNVYIFINLSGRHLTQANQLNKLITSLTVNFDEPHRLILEFNESAFQKYPELALKGLYKLKNIGVKLALDDYGTGLSSFNYLHNYPFEFIKLDRSFIRSLSTSEKNLPLIKALHELGESFGYRLIAEGIETEEALQKLNSVGCDFGQGFHISPPLRMDTQVPLLSIESKAS